MYLVKGIFKTASYEHTVIKITLTRLVDAELYYKGVVAEHCINRRDLAEIDIMLIDTTNNETYQRCIIK